MGSRQEAVKAFLDAVSGDDSSMLDRWIPDEDWVRQIRDNGKNECTIVNLNTGMSKQCSWQNNHATLQGQTIYYNKKHIRTLKTATANKPIRFYYVLSTGKPAPNVPSNQGFWQALWDAEDRSNRSLKRTAPQGAATTKPSSTPPTKKAKQSSAPPNSFEAANQMVQEAWKVAFPSLRFPVELIGLYPASKSPLVEAPHQRPPALRSQPTNDDSSKLKVAINKNFESKLMKERAFFMSLKKVLSHSSNQPTQHTKHLLAAFAASHPQISVIYQEMLISLARYTFLLEVKAVLDCSGKAKGMDMSFVTLENVSNSSPCATSLTNWVTALARDQYLIFSRKIENSTTFCQSDGGQKGQEVRLFATFDPEDKSKAKDGSICSFWADLTYTGKTSDEVAAGMQQSLRKFGLDNKQISGSTSDSGAGTPESFAKSCNTLGIWHNRGMVDSCGLHDIQSVFRLAMQQYVGEGGLDSRNAIQLLHTVFSLYNELRPRWKRVVKLLWAKTHTQQDEMPDDLLNSTDAPKDLLKAMQEPLITRWWTIGSLAILTAKHLDFFLLVAKGVCNMTKTVEKDNVIASNLLSLASSQWIVADVFFVAGVAKSWLNPHMRFYQGIDQNIGEPGFLSYHRQVRFFLMMEDIIGMKRNWRGQESFSQFSSLVDQMSDLKLRKLKEEMVSAFLTKMKTQIRKHNKRYLLTRNLVRAVFSEWQTGQAVAQFLKGGEPSLSAPFFSALHGREIDCEKFFKFMKKEVPLTVLEQLRSDPAVVFQQDAIDEIAVSGLNVWDRTNSNRSSHLFRKRALQQYAAQASTQHNNERLVKLGAQMASTGKSEIMASVFAIASNDFMSEYHDVETYQEPANQPAEAEAPAPAEAVPVVPAAEAQAAGAGGPTEEEAPAAGAGAVRTEEMPAEEAEQAAPAEAHAQAPAEVVEEDEPSRRNRGNNRGKKKLLDIERVVKEKERQLAAVAQTLGSDEYRRRCKRIDTCLKSKDDNLREKSGKAKAQKMMERIDEIQPSNARQRQRGEDLPPRLLGYFLYRRMALKANVTQLETELEAREVLFDRKLGVTKKLDILKLSEQRRFEEVADADLRRRGYQCHPDLKLPAKIQLIKQDAKEKEEHAGGEYDVDITKFFKLVSTNVDQSIFED
jgi:hypothetical protein